MLNYHLYISKSYGKQNLPFRSAFVLLRECVFRNVTVIVLLLSDVYLFLSVFKAETALSTAKPICLVWLESYPTGKDQLLKFSCVIHVMIGSTFFVFLQLQIILKL